MFYILVDAAEEVGILFFCQPPAANISLLLQAVYAVFVIKKKSVLTQNATEKKLDPISSSHQSPTAGHRGQQFC